jgi:hypothetical protein
MRLLSAQGEAIKGWPLAESLLKGGCGVAADLKAVLPKAEKPAGVRLWRL